jgi:hypothetical protein
MASSDGSSTQDEQLPEKKEKKAIAINISVKIPRRKATLITITLLLNILHWSSIVCLSTSIYHIASHPNDYTSMPSEVLTSASVSLRNLCVFTESELTSVGNSHNLVRLPAHDRLDQAEDLDTPTRT